MKKIALLFLGFSFFFFACKKEKEPEIQRLNPAGMKYIQLRPNQFFIYKDSASGKTDSVVVTESILKVETITSNGWFGPQTTTREVYYLTLTKKGSVSDSTWISGKAYGFGDLLPVVMLQGDSAMFYFNYPAYNDGRRDLYMIPSCLIEDVTYVDVIVVRNVFADYIRVYYWAPLVGLIKVTRTDGSLPERTFTLLRHN